MENQKNIDINEKSNTTSTIIPLISVLMPVYNVKDYMHESVDSILTQTETNFELIIIDDCSADGTREIVSDYVKKDNRIVVVFNDENLGLVESLNKGIALARGKYIARMDGDDISAPDRFQKQVKYLESNNLDIVGCQCVLFTDNIDNGKNLDYPLSDKACKKFLERSNAMAHPARLGKAEVFRNLKYRNITATEDYDFLIRAVGAGYKIGNAPDRCFYYRINDKGISGSQGAKQTIISRFLAENYRKNHKFSITEYEKWVSSADFSELVKKEQALVSKLEKARNKGKLVKIIGTITNYSWVRQRIVRTRNSRIIQSERKNR